MGEVAYAIGLALELLYGSFQWFLSLAMAKGNENRKQNLSMLEPLNDDSGRPYL